MAASHYDVIVLGAGAAGLMAAAEAGKRGRSVLLIDHGSAPGEKIRISGGGRCNFTNVHCGPKNFLSENPHFAISALSRFTPADFIRRVQAAGIAFHEKTLGQLFCDGPATQIVAMLAGDCARAGVVTQLGTAIEAVAKTESGFELTLSSDHVTCKSLIAATGGKSIPKIGATGLAYLLAEQFGLKVTDTRPGLVPLTFEPMLLESLKGLAGVSTEAEVSLGKARFREALLFTHRGLSGPAILQISNYWREGEAITINLAPGIDVFERLRAARQVNGRQAPQTVLAQFLPRALAQHLAAGSATPLGEHSDAALAAFAASVRAWRVKPSGSEGYRTAEVTLGGVSTAGLDQKTMQAKAVPGLYFAGEAVDVTGWLGGHNFQWAWASGWAAGQAA